MKTILFLTIATLAIARGLVGCKESNTPGMPPGLSYFAFADTSKTAILRAGGLLVERVDLLDTTKVIASQRLSFPNTVQFYSNQRYKYTFTMALEGALFVRGKNKLRLVSAGQPGADWLEFDNSAEEWISPTQVRFNGKLIERVATAQPTRTSFLYVLD